MTTLATTPLSAASEDAVDPSVDSAIFGEFHVLNAFIVKFVVASAPEIDPLKWAASGMVYRANMPMMPIARFHLEPPQPLTQTVKVNSGLLGGYHGTMTFTLNETADTLTLAYDLQRATLPGKKTGTLVYHWN